MIPTELNDSPSVPVRERSERGAVGVEFALLVIPFMMIVLGIIQYSVGYNKLQSLHASAREGARAGALVPGNECATAQSAMVSGGVGAGTCTVLASCPGEASEVTMTAPYSINLILFSTNVALTGRGEFRCEI
ncbi:MAG: hypothetical protein ACI8Y4_003936 [Candidatus Poriferisodalaceae bacterium]|jgi:hypothetical protein